MLPEGKWLWKNKVALHALIEGRAAVVTLALDDHTSAESALWEKSVNCVCLDKPMENKQWKSE